MMLTDAWPWQAIKQTYEDWELHHRAEVEFENNPATKSITLEISAPKDEEFNLWDFYSVTPLQVHANQYINDL